MSVAELGDEPGPEYEAEVAQDVLYFQLYRTRATSFSARFPSSGLHAVSAHDFLATPPLLFRQPQIVG